MSISSSPNAIACRFECPFGALDEGRGGGSGETTRCVGHDRGGRRESRERSEGGTLVLVDRPGLVGEKVNVKGGGRGSEVGRSRRPT